MKHSIILILIFLAIFQFGKSQTILFSEDFESGEIPLAWKDEFVKGSINWRYEPGGYSLNPEIPNSRKPMAPHGGLYNALFQFQSAGSEATRLVTKKIEALEFAIKPELHFFHAQMDWKHGSDFYHDYLKVYYKSNEDDPWTLLRSYTEATTGWVERIILLPEDDLSADYYLAFEGETKWGYGTCVDDIQIIETGIQQKYLADISVEQASEVSVSSGTSNNPVLKLKIKVMGNSGTLPLNSLVLQSLNTTDDDIEADGVKIFYTADAGFSSDHQIGSGVSFLNGQASFTGLNYDLPTGYSYLWLTYDVDQSAGHRHIIDAKLAPNSININGTTYFSVEKSPAGSCTIMQSIYSEDFESATDWTLSNEFEMGSPQGLGGSQGNPDPDQAYSGNNVIGTDLTGLGTYFGDYEKNLNTDEYYAISDTLDLTYYNDLSLRYMRYLNIGVNDEAFIRISPDGGQTWKTAWYNSSMILDDTWKLHEIDITPFAARKNKVLIKYSLGSTNDYWQLSGWNVDNVTVTGKFVSKDVGISRIIYPVNGCGHTSSDSVTVMVRNFGATDSYGVIPLKYSIDGKATFTYDTLYQVIPFGDSALFTFEKKASLSVPDIYNFYVSTGMTDDDDLSNNAIEKQLYAQPTVSEDFIEHFESKGGLWIPFAGTLVNWECGTPGFGIDPPSGSRVWMTKLTSNYPDNDSSFIESVCYSNAEFKRKILRVKYWAQSESHQDGVILQYTADNGISWHPVDTLPNQWNWYNDTIQSLNSRGWAGSSDGWVSAAILLPASVTNEPMVKYRLHFISNESNNNVGLAFDDFSVTNAPHDIGISSVENLTDACQGINSDSVSVLIRNYGVNKLKQNDTLIAGFDLNNEKVVIDTLVLGSELPPGQTITYKFSKPADIKDPGEYIISAFTLIERDPWFYGGNNDTARVNFTVFPNPITSLIDSIQTHMPDTVVLETYLNADYDYWWNGIPGANTYQVTDDGWQILKVTATRGNGCSAYDSANVILLFNDAGIIDLLHPVNDCGFSKTEKPVVRIKNFGTDSIYAGQKITVGYNINDGETITDTLILNTSLHAGETIDFTFYRGEADLSQMGSYRFKVYTSYGGDTIAGNDTLMRDVEILGRPDVNLGPDITVEALSHILDAGTGFESYEWDNGASGQTREIFETGNFWVRVTDQNQCDNYDTVLVRLKIRDVSPSGFESPVSDCSYNAAEPVIFRIVNSGTDTVPAGSLIALSFRFNGSEPVTDTLIADELIPGEAALFTFNVQVNLSVPGDYPVEASVALNGDLRVSNDTLKTTIYRYDKPVADFGLEETVYIEDVSFDIGTSYHPSYAYQWHDTAFHTQAYTATVSGLCHVTVTDTRTLCFDRDSVMVFLIYSDVGVTWSDMPQNGCTGEFRNVKVRVTNLGPSVIGNSAPIYVACDVNGSRVALDTLIRTGNFNSGANVELDLSGSIAISDEGPSLIHFYTLYSEDKKPENDSLETVFSALPAPVVEFGDENGNLSVDLPYVLDAGSGHQSYLWQDNSTSQTYNVTEMGEYSVIVTGINDCMTSKTVRINMESAVSEIASSEVSVYPNPNQGMFRIRMDEQAGDITLRIVNNNGQVVYLRKLTFKELSNESIDVQGLSRGIYYLLLQTRDGLVRGKMVIE